LHAREGLAQAQGRRVHRDRRDRDDEKRRWLVEKTGQRTVPQIFIDGVSVGGSDDIHALDRAGKLDPLLKLNG
jgi:glutaredoxin 3